MIKINSSGHTSSSSSIVAQNKQRLSKNTNYQNGYSRNSNERKKRDKYKKILFGVLVVINFSMILVAMFNRAHLRSSFTMGSLVLFAMTMGNIAIFQVRNFIL